MLGGGALAPEARTPSRLAASPPPIASITVPSHERLGAVRRCLESHIASAKRHARSNDFIVFNDSKDPEVCRSYRRLMSALARRHGVTIRHADVIDKGRYAGDLVRLGAPPEVVAFALFDSEGAGTRTLGANINAMLLDTVGDMVLSVDDDTECKIATAPRPEARLVLAAGQPSPFETRLYPDRGSLLRAMSWVDADLLALHEQVLGKTVLACIEAFQPHVQVQVIPGPAVRSSESVASAEADVAVTLNGIVGDSGSVVPVSLFLPRPCLAHLSRTEPGYRTLRLTREIFRFGNDTVLTDRFPFMMSTFFGLDNRRLVPPALPVGRGMDGLFADTLSRCRPGAHAARLPWSLLHAPGEPRAFNPEDLTRNLGARRLATLLRRIVSGVDTRTCSDPCRRIGAALQEVGGLPPPEFVRHMRGVFRAGIEALIGQLEARVRQFGPEFPDWVQDVNIYAEAHRALLEDVDGWLPADLLPARDTVAVAELVQRIVMKFGAALVDWPDVVACASLLRQRGRRLSAAC